MTDNLVFFRKIRILLTPLLLLSGNSIIGTVFLLLLLDTSDCLSLFFKHKCSTNWNYQKYDKIIDLFHYFIAIFILSINGKIKKEFLFILIVFYLWRCIGVILFIRYKDVRFLIPFFDFIKELLVIYVFFKNNIYVYIIGIVLKIMFEIFLHGKKIKYV